MPLAQLVVGDQALHGGGQARPVVGQQPGLAVDDRLRQPADAQRHARRPARRGLHHRQAPALGRGRRQVHPRPRVQLRLLAPRRRARAGRRGRRARARAISASSAGRWSPSPAMSSTAPGIASTHVQQQLDPLVALQPPEIEQPRRLRARAAAPRRTGPRPGSRRARRLGRSPSATMSRLRRLGDRQERRAARRAASAAASRPPAPPPRPCARARSRSGRGGCGARASRAACGSHSGVRNVIPLTTSSTTSASRASPRRTAHAARGKTVTREPMWCSSSPGAGRETALRAVVGARDDRHAMAPLEPVRDLPEQVRARAAALRVRPVAVGQQQDVRPSPRMTVADGGRSTLARSCRSDRAPARLRRRRGRARPLPPPPSRRAPATTSTPTRSATSRAGGDARADAARARRHGHARARAVRRARHARCQPGRRPPRRPRPAGPTPAVHGRRRLAARRSAGALLLGAGLALRARLREPRLS